MKLPFLLIVVMALAACAAPPARPSASPLAQPAPTLGQPFTLAIGQSATLSDAPLKITFDGVSEDSRCPKQVNCVWSGQAVLDLTAQVGESAPVTLTLTTIHSPDKTDRATFNGYEIVLQAVQPYPETPDNPIKREDYRAKFVVQRAAAP